MARSIDNVFDLARIAPFALAGLLGATGCASDLQRQLDHTRVELQKARLDAQQAQTQAERSRLEADRARVTAQTMAHENAALRAQVDELAASAATAAATGILQGRFRFAGRAAQVDLSVRGGDVNETFNSDKKGRIAIELPSGTYSATATAKGYEPLEFEFTLPGDQLLVEPELTKPGKKSSAKKSSKK